MRGTRKISNVRPEIFATGGKTQLRPEFSSHHLPPPPAYIKVRAKGGSGSFLCPTGLRTAWRKSGGTFGGIGDRTRCQGPKAGYPAPFGDRRRKSRRDPQFFARGNRRKGNATKKPLNPDGRSKRLSATDPNLWLLPGLLSRSRDYSNQLANQESPGFTGLPGAPGQTGKHRSNFG